MRRDWSLGLSQRLLASKMATAICLHQLVVLLQLPTERWRLWLLAEAVLEVTRRQDCLLLEDRAAYLHDLTLRCDALYFAK